MKRFVAVLSGILVLPAFAEVAPVYYDEINDFQMDVLTDENVSDDFVDVDEIDAQKVKKSQNTTSRVSGRVAASRNVNVVDSKKQVSGRSRSNNSARVVSARGTVNNSGRVVASARGTVARIGNTSAENGRVTGGNTKTVVPTRNSTVSGNTVARSSIVQTDTVNTSLYNATGSNAYTGRVGVRNTTSRVPTIRMAATGLTSSSDNATTAVVSTREMDELSELTDYCKAQYAQCMDNFCNVLDDNQGRCSCSANLKNYAKTEAALKQATLDLQEIAQKIQYIGLNSKEIETLFTQTEAELTMQKTNDNTQLKNDLDKIKNLIVDVKSGSVASSESGGLSFDLSGLLDFTIDSTGFDLNSLFGTTSNTSSISNQRGEELFKTAKSRCKATVLNNCTAQGVDASIVTNSYDLEIDKQCIVYERSLTESNNQMAATVRNAKSVLQKARLMVAQQKNSYDMRGCVNALDSCMQDDFVCGSDYENCLDPTGKYIVSGNIVVGSTPGQALDSLTAPSGNVNDSSLFKTVWGYETSKNAWANDDSDGSLAEYIDKTVTATSAKSTSVSMSEYLQYKIGYNDGTKNYGMCMSVLNKCQDLTYTGTGSNMKYNPQNNVVKEYLQRTLTQIKARQNTILADYAEACISDVSSCLAQNNYPENPTNNSTSANIAINACRSIISTCMSVNGNTTANPQPTEMFTWVSGILSANSTNSSND